MKIRLAAPNIQKDSVVDGEGIRAVIWTQGCSHNCPGCHNPETHDFNAGYLVDIADIKKQIEELVTSHNGITLSGGDPLMQVDSCLELAKYAESLGLNVWCYTGFTFEELLLASKSKPIIKEFLNTIDVLVDGRFKIEEKTFDAIFRGSKNQRIIDTKKSLIKNKAVEISKYKINKPIKMVQEQHLYI